MKNILRSRILQFSLVLIVGLVIGWLLFKGDQPDQQTYPADASEVAEWTCSMHPQIRQNAPGKCPICGMDLIPVFKQTAPAGQSSSFVHTMSPEAVALANIQTAKVSYAPPEHEIYLTGKIAANEQRLAVIAANYSGRIEKLVVDFTGQAVSKGQLLAIIYSPELITAQQELLQAAKTKGINPVLYNAVREKLRLWKITEKQINAVEESGTVVSEFEVYADMSGIVLRREVSTGDYVSKGSVLFEIADLSSVWVLLDAYESDLPWVKIGARVNFTAASLPGKEFTSTVTFIDLLINPQTRTASVRAEAANPGLDLKPEMFVTAKIKALPAIKEKKLAIPRTSLLWTGIRSVVYVKIPGSDVPTFEMREVDIGPRAGESYIVESGLQAGEEVVINGAFAIDAAAQLSGNYSMMSRPQHNRSGVPAKFQSQLTELINHYFDLKNALVESDSIKSRTSAAKLLQSFQLVDMKILDDIAHQTWMDLAKPLLHSMEMLSNANTLQEQRKQFAAVSEAMIKVIETFGITIETVYVDYCPMALDEKGAYWLSEYEEIKNPYFGDAMLRCGEVRKKIRSAENDQETRERPRLEHRH